MFYDSHMGQEAGISLRKRGCDGQGVSMERMKLRGKILRTGIAVEGIVLMLCAGMLLGDYHRELRQAQVDRAFDEEKYLAVQGEDSYIKWVDFNVSYEALCRAYDLDVESQTQEVKLHWIELLAYAASKTGGSFDRQALEYIDEAAEELKNGITVEKLTADLKYYSYYKEAYDAVLGGLVGEYEMETEPGKWETHYGLKGFNPIAKGFEYSDYDDFGVSRSYGYARPHLGHDMMGLIGTPIVAVESGYVEAIGWNQYGGWRIGIRSEDGRRYYYYAHLRQDRPYAEGLAEGDEVTAGDVIGYMGHTGYSTTENVNNIDSVHLHWGLQLIFDESQKEGSNEIWVDCYALTRFLSRNRCEVVRDDATKEWTRKCDMRE